MKKTLRLLCAGQTHAVSRKKLPVLVLGLAGLSETFSQCFLGWMLKVSTLISLGGVTTTGTYMQAMVISLFCAQSRMVMGND